MKQFPVLPSLGIIIFLIGCSASITRSGYHIDDLQKNLIKCADIAIKNNATFSQNEVIILGKVSASDSGLSTDCSEEYVLDILKKDACTVGADIINITEESQPDFWTSSCYRAEAELIKFKDRNQVVNIKSDSQYSSELIKARSKQTQCMNQGAVAAGIGGAISGLIGGAIILSGTSSTCTSAGADRKESSTTGSTPDIEYNH